MKSLLIISPYFPPANAADMQRIRMSLPYFKDLGWNVTVVTVDEQYYDLAKDDLLLQSVPTDVGLIKIGALNKNITSKLGLGSLALRSLWFYRRKVNQLLRLNKYDLIYFSTTQFPVCILGPYWQKRFNMPYVIDFQDPWHSDYYRDKPKHQRPPKYWFSYRLNKFLEPIAVKNAAGLISVSPGYIDGLKKRYFQIKNIPAAIIPFGAFKPDLEIATANSHLFHNLLDTSCVNLVYVGRGGTDMLQALTVLFAGLKNGLTEHPSLKKLKLYFIGTSYAPDGKAKETIMPLALQMGIANQVVEITNRISYYHALSTLQQADALIMPGSDDPQYSASKIYPCLLTRKPLLSIFHSQSPALTIFKEFGAENAYSFDKTADLQSKIISFFLKAANGSFEPVTYQVEAKNKYDAQNMTLLQCELFNKVLGE